MKRKTNKRLSLALSMIMAITSINIASPLSYAQKDIQNHWARETLTKWQQNGYIKGDEKGNLNPDKSITRAEFITIINKAMGYSKQGEKIKSYTDVKEKDWYYKEIMTALEQGYISGTGENKISPNSKITRQEVMVIINKIANIKNQENFDITKVKDHKKIATWANTSAINMISNGYIAGYDGNINPEKEMKRAEAIVLIDAYKENNRTLSFEGQYNLSQANKVTILTGNIKIKDSKINELIISEKAKGKIELEKVEITGKTTNNSKEAELYLNGEKVQIKDGKIEKTNDKEQEAKYKDGQYEGKASGYGGDIKVKVTIKDGKIEKIEVVEQKEDAIYWNAAKKVIDRIIEKQDTQVDASAGATISSKGIMFAVEDALKKAENKKEEVKPKENYKDGEYIGESGGFSGTVKVKVTIKQSKIEDLEVIQHSDDEPYMQSAKNLISKIKDKQNPDVDIISGATYSSQGIINATKDALEQAKGKTKRPGQSEHALKNLSGGGSGGGSGNAGKKIERDFHNLTDGEYEGEALGYKTQPMKVRLIVSGGKIIKIEIIKSYEDRAYFSLEKEKKLIEKIINKQSTKVDTMSGATYSSIGLINAVVKAVDNGPTVNVSSDYDAKGASLGKMRVLSSAIAKNATIQGDLEIAKEVEDGTVTIESINVNGNVYIKGGGSNSVYFKNSIINGEVLVEKENTDKNQAVKVEFKENTQLKSIVKVKNSSKIQTDKTVKIPTLEISEKLGENNSKVQLQANIGTLRILVKANADITLEKGSRLENISLPGNVEKYEKGKKSYEDKKSNLKISIQDNVSITGSLEKFMDPDKDYDSHKVYQDGVWKGKALGFSSSGRYVNVEVTVENGKFVSVKTVKPPIGEQGEAEDYLQRSKMTQYLNKHKEPQKIALMMDKYFEIVRGVINLKDEPEKAQDFAKKLMPNYDVNIINILKTSNNDIINSFISNLAKDYIKDSGVSTQELVDSVSGATFTSAGIALATREALKVSELAAKDSNAIKSISFGDVVFDPSGSGTGFNKLIKEHLVKKIYIGPDFKLDLTGLTVEVERANSKKELISYPDFDKNNLFVYFEDDISKTPLKGGEDVSKYVQYAGFILIVQEKNTGVLARTASAIPVREAPVEKLKSSKLRIIIDNNTVEVDDLDWKKLNTGNKATIEITVPKTYKNKNMKVELGFDENGKIEFIPLTNINDYSQLFKIAESSYSPIIRGKTNVATTSYDLNIKLTDSNDITIGPKAGITPPPPPPPSESKVKEIKVLDTDYKVSYNEIQKFDFSKLEVELTREDNTKTNVKFKDFKENNLSIKLKIETKKEYGELPDIKQNNIRTCLENFDVFTKLEDNKVKLVVVYDKDDEPKYAEMKEISINLQKNKLTPSTINVRKVNEDIIVSKPYSTTDVQLIFLNDEQIEQIKNQKIEFIIEINDTEPLELTSEEYDFAENSIDNIKIDESQLDIRDYLDPLNIKFVAESSTMAGKFKPVIVEGVIAPLDEPLTNAKDKVKTEKIYSSWISNYLEIKDSISDITFVNPDDERFKNEGPNNIIIKIKFTDGSEKEVSIPVDVKDVYFENNDYFIYMNIVFNKNTKSIVYIDDLSAIQEAEIKEASKEFLAKLVNIQELDTKLDTIKDEFIAEKEKTVTPDNLDEFKLIINIIYQGLKSAMQKQLS